MSATAQSYAEINGDNLEVDQYLTFFLNDQEYAVDILKVQGIQGWSECTPLPNTPEQVLGVINLRGAIVPIVDMRIRFALADVSYTDVTVVIVVKVVLEDSEKVVGLVVDAVEEVYNIDKSELSMAPDFGGDIDVEYIKGLATIDDKLIIVLNVDKLIGESILQKIDTELVE